MLPVFQCQSYTCKTSRLVCTSFILPDFLQSLDVPTLPPLPGLQQNEDEEQDEDDNKSEDKPERSRKTSGPKTVDPYASDESSLLLPVLVALGVFIPTLFCLCKL